MRSPIVVDESISEEWSRVQTAESVLQIQQHASSSFTPSLIDLDGGG